MPKLMIAAASFETQADEHRLAAEVIGDDIGSAHLKPKSAQLSRSNSRSSRSSSQRFAGNLQRRASASAAPPIIVLPRKIQRSVSYGRCKFRATSTRIFPKKAGSGGRKTVVPDDEPSSPKVSCIGKVLSEREREKCRRKLQAKKSEKKENNKKTEEDACGGGGGAEAAGCWGTLALLFHCYGGGGGRNRVAVAECVDYDLVSPPMLAASDLPLAGKKPVPPGSEAVEPPQLAAMKLFASGRRSATWVATWKSTGTWSRDTRQDMGRRLNRNRGSVLFWQCILILHVRFTLVDTN